MKTVTATLTMLALLAPGVASAQSYRALRDGTGPLDDGLAGRTDDGELALPDLPPIAERRARWVALLTTVAERTVERCEMVYGEREGEYYEDERCYDAFDRLQQAGVAGVHAMGSVVVADAAEAGVEGASPEIARFIELMANSRRPEAVPYLIHALAKGNATHAVQANYALEQLGHVSLSPRATWIPSVDYDDATARRHLANQWILWYQANAGGTVSDWAEAGVVAARERLQSGDLAARMWAIEHLVDAGHPSEAAEGLRSMIADPATNGEARNHATRFARRRGLLRREEIGVLVQAAELPAGETVAAR